MATSSILTKFMNDVMHPLASELNALGDEKKLKRRKTDRTFWSRELNDKVFQSKGRKDMGPTECHGPITLMAITKPSINEDALPTWHELEDGVSTWWIRSPLVQTFPTRVLACKPKDPLPSSPQSKTRATTSS